MLDYIDEDELEPGDYCFGCGDHVASDGACYCNEDEDEEEYE